MRHSWGSAIYFAIPLSGASLHTIGMPIPKSSSKANVKPAVQANGRAISYTAGIVLFCIVLGFILIWSRLGIGQKNQPTIAYASIGPLVTHGRGYAMAATMALQTSAADAKWAAQNKNALSEVLKATLAKADPRALHGANGLVALQETLKLATNTALHTEQVQRVLLTDFILQEAGH